jgi:hypothetical protein
MGETLMATGLRARAFRAVHAEALKRGLDHDALRDVCRQQFGVHSMGQLNEGQLIQLYKGWTGKGLRRLHPLPKRGRQPGDEGQIVSSGDLEVLGLEFAQAAWGPETQRSFIRRQLRGRDQIRTHADFKRVFQGIRAINRRSEG